MEEGLSESKLRMTMLQEEREGMEAWMRVWTLSTEPSNYSSPDFLEMLLLKPTVGD